MVVLTVAAKLFVVPSKKHMDVKADGIISAAQSQYIHDFRTACRHAELPGDYWFALGTMPEKSDWSYDKVDRCDLTTLKACDDDEDCAGVAGWKNPMDNWPPCWKIKKGKSAMEPKSDWWSCTKDRYRPLQR